MTTFGAPYAIAMPSGGNKGARATMAAAERQSAVGIGGEFGGSGTISSESLHICELGIRRLLHHLKIWSPVTLPPAAEPEETVYLNSNSENLLVYVDQA